MTDPLHREREMAQRLADDTREPALLITQGDPRDSYPSRIPYAVPLSMATAWERANAHATFEPGVKP